MASNGAGGHEPLSDSALIVGALFIACTAAGVGLLADRSVTNQTMATWDESMLAAAATPTHPCLVEIQGAQTSDGKDYKCLPGCTYTVKVGWFSGAVQVVPSGKPSNTKEPPGQVFYEALMGKPKGPIACSADGSISRTAQANFNDLNSLGYHYVAGEAQVLTGLNPSNVPLSSVTNAISNTTNPFSGQLAPGTGNQIQSRYDLNPTSNIWGTVSDWNSLSDPTQVNFPPVPSYDSTFDGILEPKQSDYLYFSVLEPPQLPSGLINTDLSSSLVQEENLSQHLSSQELANWNAENPGAPVVSQPPPAQSPVDNSMFPDTLPTAQMPWDDVTEAGMEDRNIYDYANWVACRNNQGCLDKYRQFFPNTSVSNPRSQLPILDGRWSMF